MHVEKKHTIAKRGIQRKIRIAEQISQEREEEKSSFCEINGADEYFYHAVIPIYFKSDPFSWR